jgi:uncharacterized protein YggE
MVLAVVLSGLAVSTVAQAAGRAASSTTLTVTGRGASVVTPRKVEISMNVRTSKSTAEASRAANATRVGELRSNLSGISGLDAKSVKLGTPSTYAATESDGNGNVRRTGWVTEQPVTVVAKAKTASNVAGQVFDAGARFAADVSAVTPIVSARAYEGARQRAENQALKNAQKRATKMARTMGKKLGGVAAIQGDEGDSSFVPRPSLALEARAQAPAAPTTEFDLSGQRIAETRTVVFKLKSR